MAFVQLRDSLVIVIACAGLAACGDDLPVGGRDLGDGKRLLASINCGSGRQVFVETTCTEPVFLSIHYGSCGDEDPLGCPAVISGAGDAATEFALPFICPQTGRAYVIVVLPNNLPSTAYSCTTSVTES